EGGAESSYEIEKLAPRHQAGTGHGEEVPGDLEIVRVARRVPRPAVIWMAGEAAFEVDAAVLKAPVFAKQPGAARAAPVELRVHDQPLEPIRRCDLDVVVKQEKMV